MTNTVDDYEFDEDFKYILSLARDNAETDWEESFIKSLQIKYDTYDDNMFFSEAQRAKLMSIAYGPEEI